MFNFENTSSHITGRSTADRDDYEKFNRIPIVRTDFKQIQEFKDLERAKEKLKEREKNLTPEFKLPKLVNNGD